MDQYATDKHKRVSAKAIIQVEDGRILLVKDNWKNYWSFPGGVVEANESPFEAVQREVFEETSLKPVFQNFLGCDYRRDEQKESLTFTFSATMSEAELTEQFHAQDGEGEAWKLVTPREALELLEDKTAARLPELLKHWNSASLYTENGKPLS